MTRVPAALAVLVVAAYAPGSPAQRMDGTSAVPLDRPRPSDWSFEFGAGALALPSFPGAASMRVLPLPWIDVHYRDRVFLSPISGLGVNLITLPEARFGVAVLPNLGRSASSSDRLRGFGDIGAGADLKVFGQLHLLGPVAALAAVRRQLGAGNGTLVEAGLTGVVPLLRRLTVFATGTLTWANGRYTQSYFGVDPDQSAAASLHGLTLQPYAAGAGLRDATVALFARIRLDQHWSVQPVVRTEILLGDAANSPLVERRFQLTFGGFLAYRL